MQVEARSLVAAAALVSLFIGAGMADSAVSAKNGEFAFAEEVPAPGHDSGAKSIVVMNANGSGKTVLTHHFLTEANPALVNDSEPDWSPNGTEIAFTRSRQAPNAAAPTTGIEVMNADGSGQTRLTHGAKNDHSPVWSPDGKKIAFVRDLKPGARQYGEIYVMNANGSGQRRLTQVVLCEGAAAGAREPAWSPDGTKIAFTGEEASSPCNDGIYVMNANGSGKTRLTGNDPNDGGASQPAWSPDGTKITFMGVSSYDTYDFEVYVMKADGSGRRRLTKNDGFCPYKCPNRETHIQPTWSPDGKKIAFTRYIPPKTIDQYDRYDVFAMNADGSGQALVARYILDGVDWGPVPTGARNPLPVAKITVHPALRLRCMYGSGPAREAAFVGKVAPAKGVREVEFYVNGKVPHAYTGVGWPLFEFAVYPAMMPKTPTWTVKAVVWVTVGESEVSLVLTKRHAGHC